MGWTRLSKQREQSRTEEKQAPIERTNGSEQLRTHNIHYIIRVPYEPRQDATRPDPPPRSIRDSLYIPVDFLLVLKSDIRPF